MQAISQNAVASRSTPTNLPAVGFGATLRSEWSKFTSARMTWISLALALVLSVGLTMLLSWAVGFSFDDWNEADRATFDPITLSMSGLLVSGIIFVVLGVNLVASEYSSGMIRQTIATTPKRGRVLMAKVIVVGAVALVAGLVVNTAVILAGNLVFGAYDMPTASLSDGDTLRAIFGLTITTPVFPILGVAVAFLLRSAAGAITAVLALLFLPSMFGPLLPSRWQEDVLGWLPGPLTDSISIGFLDSDGAMMKNAWVAGGALIIWLALFLGAAWWFLTNRDA
jgi:ABC-2 type transport system permease protein